MKLALDYCYSRIQCLLTGRITRNLSRYKETSPVCFLDSSWLGVANMKERLGSSITPMVQRSEWFKNLAQWWRHPSTNLVYRPRNGASWWSICVFDMMTSSSSSIQLRISRRRSLRMFIGLNQMRSLWQWLAASLTVWRRLKHCWPMSTDGLLKSSFRSFSLFMLFMITGKGDN